jgi:8-oxo-dGTP diphosphatase
VRTPEGPTASLGTTGRRRPLLRARLVILRGPAGGEEVLLAHHRHPDRAFWCFPGGACEPGETLAQAAVREAAEETGLAVVLEGVCFLQDRPAAEAVDVFFRARPAGGTLALGSDPDRPPHLAPVLTDLRWWPLDRLPQLTVLPAALAGALADRRFFAWGCLALPDTAEA